MTTHLFIPDPQVRPGVNLAHLEALGHFIVDKQPDKIICIGDFADMPSLSSYEKPGSKHLENARYADDIHSAEVGMDLLLNPLREYNARNIRNKKAQYKPKMIMTLGNHEDRISRAINSDPIRLEGVISLGDLPYDDWEVHPFLDIVEEDGILYSHYFCNPDSLMNNPVGGTIENKLRLIGSSFSMGHQQKRQYGTRYNARGDEMHGLVCGAFYMHDEAYLGPQKNRHYWRGVVMKHEVKDGEYDPMFVSLDYLISKYH